MEFHRRISVALAIACAPFAAAAQAPASKAEAPKAEAAACSKVRLTTSSGPIVIELDAAKAPKTVENFRKYVQSGHYAGTVFHRVIDGFMIQGGGFTKEMQQKQTNAPIAIESNTGLKNEPYTIAMARTSNPNSATSQFFINVANNEMLNYAGDMNPGYAVFGKVTEGKETVDKIRKVATGNAGMHQNVPTTPVVIEKAECQ